LRAGIWFGNVFLLGKIDPVLFDEKNHIFQIGIKTARDFAKGNGVEIAQENINLSEATN